jgi:hypothetical protein
VLRDCTDSRIVPGNHGAGSVERLADEITALLRAQA